MHSETPSAPAPAAAAAAEALPARTTPTWEMELLLSGATVFALFQLYAALAPLTYALPELLSRQVAPPALTLLVYLQAGVLGLAMGFVCHLVLRGYWIAAVGMYSVDPAGDVRHSANLGPWQRARVAASWDGLPQRIAVLDDTATVVFASALGLAKLMLQLFTYVLVLVLLSILIDTLSGGRLSAPWVVLALSVLLLGPFTAAILLDNRAGRRGRSTAPGVVRVLSAYDRIGMTAQHNLGLQMAIHRVSGRSNKVRGVLVFNVVLIVLMITSTVLPYLMRDDLGSLLRSGFPRLSIGDASTLRSMHYASRSPERSKARLPLIPDEQVKGDYLRLFIPFVGEWHDAGLRACAKAQGSDAWRTDPASAAAVMQCVAARQPLHIDGSAVSAPWLLSEDLRRDQRGFVVMIDVQSLPRGQHELSVAQVASDDPDDEDDKPWRIPFWR